MTWIHNLQNLGNWPCVRSQASGDNIQAWQCFFDENISSVVERCSHLDQPCVYAFDSELQGQKNFAVAFADEVMPPQGIIAPDLTQLLGEGEHVPGIGGDEGTVIVCRPRGEVVSGNALSACGPLRKTPKGVFPGPLDSILGREADADHGKHQVVADIERIPLAGRSAGLAEPGPALADGSQVRESARLTLRDELCLFLRIENLVPFHEGQVGAFFGAAVFRDRVLRAPKGFRKNRGNRYEIMLSRGATSLENHDR